MKKILALILAVSMTATLCACGSSVSSSSSETAATTTAAAAEGSDESADETEPLLSAPLEIKLTTTDPTGCCTVDDLYACAEEIYERTDGMIDIQVYPDGQMLVYDEGVEAVMSNAAVIQVTTPSYYVDYVPVLSTLASPYLFSSREVAEAFFQSDYFEGIRQECVDAGFYCICCDGLIGYRSVCATSPVYSLDDLRKLCLRISSGDVMVKLFTAFGANFTVMSFSDVFNALQTGAIDGLECVPLTITANYLYDAASPLYYSETRHLLDCYGMFVGYDFWMSIPEPYREIIDEVLGDWGRRATEDTVYEEENIIYPIYAEEDVEVIELSDEAMEEFREIGREVTLQQDRGQEVLDVIAEIEASLQ